jgi:hypothetical protein
MTEERPKERQKAQRNSAGRERLVNLGETAAMNLSQVEKYVETATSKLNPSFCTT